MKTGPGLYGLGREDENGRFQIELENLDNDKWNLWTIIAKDTKETIGIFGQNLIYCGNDVRNFSRSQTVYSKKCNDGSKEEVRLL